MLEDNERLTLTLENGKGTYIFYPGKLKIKDWFIAKQAAFVSLAIDKELRGNDRRVLDYLFGHLEFENYIYITQKEIATRLGMTSQGVSTSIKLLVKKSILEKGPKWGCSYSYRLNHFYAWKGSVKSLDEHKKSHLSLVK